MSELVEKLKKQHEEILSGLDEIRKIGRTSEIGFEKLLQMKEKIIEHLKLEDEELYPVLEKEAEKNEKLRKTLDTFAKEMDGITIKIMDFFDRYKTHGDVLRSFSFVEEIIRLTLSLRDRIMREEIIIYKLYDDIHSS